MGNYIVAEQINMEKLLGESVEFSPPKIGELVSGIVLSKNKSQIMVDVGGTNIGIINGREVNDSFNTAKTLNIGDKVSVVVLEDENENGVLILSIRKAGQFNTWDRLKEAMKNGTIVTVVPNQANKGGLLVDLDGIKAFIPVSQLAPEHYPRVENSDSGKILQKLQKLVGKSLQVCVININETTGKMILSEKEARKGDQDQTLKGLDIGSVINGKVTGVSKFGFFVTFGDLEGLVHISEIAWGHVSDPQKYVAVGDNIDVKVIGIEGNKISLSLKRMHDDPWITLTQKYKVGDKVKGVVNKVSEFGAFVSLEEDVNGLIHLSEIEDGATDARLYFSVGQEIEAVIIEINTEEHRIALSVKGVIEVKKKPRSKMLDKIDDSSEELNVLDEGIETEKSDKKKVVKKEVSEKEKKTDAKKEVKVEKDKKEEKAQKSEVKTEKKKETKKEGTKK